MYLFKIYLRLHPYKLFNAIRNLACATTCVPDIILIMMQNTRLIPAYLTLHKGNINKIAHVTSK